MRSDWRTNCRRRIAVVDLVRPISALLRTLTHPLAARHSRTARAEIIFANLTDQSEALRAGECRKTNIPAANEAVDRN